ncbi:MAG TPA: site-2 protease family protein [Thermodesulfovibrionia bacterium]|nr:site-2 protease family protein [Thermodesulfovibrionia bacterium]
MMISIIAFFIVFTIIVLVHELGHFIAARKAGIEDAKELFEASYFKRASIMSAGSLLNIAFAFLVFIPVFAFGKHIPFIDAIMSSIQTLWAILSGTVAFILNIFSGSGSMEGLAGPIGIASMAGQAASKGILNLMYFIGILSMSLGIMNLIPLPALDGGQLFMLFIESIRKKPLSLKTYQVVNLLGLSLFIILTVLVTYKDIVRLVV